MSDRNGAARFDCVGGRIGSGVRKHGCNPASLSCTRLRTVGTFGTFHTFGTRV